MSQEQDLEYTQAVLRLTACSTTLKSLIADVQDPLDEDKRVDLLILCDEAINHASQLYTALSFFTWGELDARTQRLATENKDPA